MRRDNWLFIFPAALDHVEINVLTAVMTALLSFLAPALMLQAAAPPAVTAPAPLPIVGAPLTLMQARRVVAAAMAAADRLGYRMAVAVVEPDGSLVAFERREGVQYASLDVAPAKARSAAMYRRPTLVFSKAMASGALQVLSLPHAVAVEGGIPLIENDRVVGAIGVSGGTAEQDGVVAAAGVAALR